MSGGARQGTFLAKHSVNQSRMQILWIKSDYIEPPDTGGKIRTYNLLFELNRRCCVTYVSLQSNAGCTSGVTTKDWASRVVTFPYSEERKSGLGFILRVLAAMFSTLPYIVQKYRSREIRDCQRELVTSPADSQSVNGDTVLVCDFLEMTENVDWSLPTPKILFQHNVESVIWRRYYEHERSPIKKAYFWFEHRRMRRYERRACNRFDMVLAVSLQDKKVLQQHVGVQTPIEIVETGVDTEYFAPQPHVEPTPGRLLFLGSLDWMPNIDGIEWFVRDVYPQVKKACPHVSIDIVGRRPIAAVQAMANGDQTVNVYGSVPDVRPFMAAADVFIVPLRIGSGTRLKIFEALAMRRPIVSTTVGAEGLPVEHGRHLLLADSPEEYAKAIASMLENPEQKQAMAREGHELVTRNYSWKTVSARLHELCLNIHGTNNTKARVS